MNFHHVEQGTEAWHELRAKYLTASEAPAMMGESKYKSRNQLLAEKKTGRKPEVSSIQQDIFNRGHLAESMARKVLEMEHLEDLAPAVCSAEIEGLSLLASLDGLTEDKDLIFEHKLWNETLAENVRNAALEPEHYWQLEHQLLVTKAQAVLFVVSDGTSDKRVMMSYRSNPDRRDRLISGWKQFVKDLDEYAPEAKKEVVVGNDAEDFPVIKYEVQGSAIISNIADVLPIITERAEREMNRSLETDQDFADKENINKAVKAARDRLKDVVSNVQGEFVSFKDFSDTAAQIDAVLQKMQSHGEKQVKQAKEEKKADIARKAVDDLNDHVHECDGKIKPLTLRSISDSIPNYDFIGAMKGKRTIDSLQNAVDSELARIKVDIDQAMQRIVPNQIFLREHAKDYAFLFADVAQIINQEIEPFQAVVKSRISDHKEREEKKADEEAKAKSAEQDKTEPEQKEDEQQQVEEAVAESQPKEEPVKKPEPHAHKDKDDEGFMSELTKWSERHRVSLKAMDELKTIIDRHYTDHQHTEAA